MGGCCQSSPTGGVHKSLICQRSGVEYYNSTSGATRATGLSSRQNTAGSLSAVAAANGSSRGGEGGNARRNRGRRRKRGRRGATKVPSQPPLDDGLTSCSSASPPMSSAAASSSSSTLPSAGPSSGSPSGPPPRVAVVDDYEPPAQLLAGLRDRDGNPAVASSVASSSSWVTAAPALSGTDREADLAAMEAWAQSVSQFGGSAGTDGSLETALDYILPPPLSQAPPEVAGITPEPQGVASDDGSGEDGGEVVPDYPDDAMAELRQRLLIDRDLSDGYLYRFLLARDLNPLKAAEMVEATEEWRVDYHPEDLVWGPPVDYELGCGKVRWLGHDAAGRASLLVYAGEHIARDSPADAAIAMVVYLMERLEACGHLTPAHPGLAVLIDFTGFGYKNVDYGMVNRLVTVVQDYYPERLGCAIIANAPWLFKVVWKVVRPMLSERTRSRIFFAASDAAEMEADLTARFDPALLPVGLGGTSTEERSDWETVLAVGR